MKAKETTEANERSFYRCEKDGLVLEMRTGGTVEFCPTCKGPVNEVPPPPGTYDRLPALFAAYDMIGYARRRNTLPRGVALPARRGELL